MKNRISYQNKTKIIESNNQKFIYKVKHPINEELYNYLRHKDFLNYLPLNKKTADYEVYRYQEYSIPKEDKGIELIYLMSMLHTKTTTYQETNMEKVKTIYEETKTKINYLRDYYFDLQDYIETKIYMSPAEFLLMKNISKFYKALNYAEQKLEEWYKLKEESKNERIVQLHNNLSIKHLLKEETVYLTNWDNSKKDIVICDFLNFYRNDYQDLEMLSLFELYQAKYKFTEEEFLLFQSLISIPEKITFQKTNYINTLEAKVKINYIDKTSDFLSKYYEKYQKGNKEKFNQ